MIHELKILPEFFKAVKKGKKTFEIRVNDRPYKVNDHLLLKEYTGTEYTGEEIKVRIKYILDDENYLLKNTVAMAIEILDGCVYPSESVTAIKIDYYEELKVKADRLEKTRTQLTYEFTNISKAMSDIDITNNLGRVERYEKLCAYRDGIRLALDFIDGNKV